MLRLGSLSVPSVAPADRGDRVCPAAEDAGPGEREGTEEGAGREHGPGAVVVTDCPFLGPQELFSKQKGYLDDELDFRKQSLDQAHKVRAARAA